FLARARGPRPHPRSPDEDRRGGSRRRRTRGGIVNDDLAVTLSILRTIRRWSQSELAEAAGVTNSAISDYERGKVDPQTQTLQKLVRALGLPLSALDQTQAFIQMIRAQTDGNGADSDEGLVSKPPAAPPREPE